MPVSEQFTSDQSSRLITKAWRYRDPKAVVGADRGRSRSAGLIGCPEPTHFREARTELPRQRGYRGAQRQGCCRPHRSERISVPEQGPSGHPGCAARRPNPSRTSALATPMCFLRARSPAPCGSRPLLKGFDTAVPKKKPLKSKRRFHCNMTGRTSPASYATSANVCSGNCSKTPGWIGDAPDWSAEPAIAPRVRAQNRTRI